MKRKQSPCKPGPVPLAGCLSFIYSAGYPTALASDGQPSADGIRELAASRWNSPTITRRLVVSYTTFSPLPTYGRSFSSPISYCHQ